MEHVETCCNVHTLLISAYYVYYGEKWKDLNILKTN